MGWGRGHVGAYYYQEGYRILVWFRRCQFFSSLANSNKIAIPLSLITRFMFRRVSVKYGFTCSSKTKIGAGLALYHPFGVVINGKAVIGENVEIGAGVVIGQAKGTPVIGNNVSISAHATVIGPITVGDNAVIGAGAIVVEDVPENAIVVCDKAHILKYKETLIHSGD